MSKLFSKVYWADVVERAVKTAAQAPLLAFTFADTGPFNMFDLDVGMVVGFAAGGALISILTSLASLPLGGGDTASALPEAVAPVAPPTPPTFAPPRDRRFDTDTPGRLPDD